VIPAGRSGKLIAKVHTKATDNHTSRKSITVTTDDPKFKTLRLTMEFTTESMLSFRPKPSFYLSTTVGEARTERLLVHRNDGKALEIKEIRFDEPSVKIHAEPYDPKKELPKEFQAEKPEGGDVWIVAEIPADSKVLTKNTKMWIRTNHPKASDVEIPVHIRIRPIIEVLPSEVRLWVEKRGARGSVFKLSHTGGKSFTIESIQAGDPELFSATVVNPEASRIHSVRVELKEDIPEDRIQKGVTSQLVIKTSDPAQPVVTVPVRLMKRRSITRPASAPPQLSARPINPRPLPTGTPNPG